MSTILAIPVKERILRQIKADLEADPNIGTVRRFDARGMENAASGDVVIAVLSETEQDAGHGNPPQVDCTMTLGIGVLLLPNESASRVTDDFVTRWQARIKSAIRANMPLLTEDDTDVRLAIQTRFTGADVPELLEGGVNASVVLEVLYRHDGGNTGEYQCSSYISLLTESVDDN